LGAVATPSDIRKGRKKALEQIAQDLDPASREEVRRILETTDEADYEEELRKRLGKRISKRLLDSLDSFHSTR
jgi:DNA-directed RNA polymerase subunit F